MMSEHLIFCMSNLVFSQVFLGLLIHISFMYFYDDCFMCLSFWKSLKLEILKMLQISNSFSGFRC